MAHDVVPTLVPRLVWGRRAPLLPMEEELDAVLLIADLAGFTKEAERLAAFGPSGVDALTTELGRRFGPLVAAVYDAGGDVLKFAGDALLAMWRADGDLASTVGRAGRTALALTASPAARDEEGRPILRVGLAAGRVRILHVGGGERRWELFLDGPAVEQLRSLKRGRPGEVLLSAAARGAAPGQLVTVGSGAGPVLLGWVAGDADTPPPPPPEPDLAVVRAYVPRFVRERIDAGQLAWLADMRRVSVVFLRLPGRDLALDALQAAVSTLQAIVEKYVGTIDKISVDDHGPVLVVAFGLPPRTHPDDPARAVRCAREMVAAVAGSGAGVATGSACCGLVGGVSRREYTMIGASVNLAARLAQAAPAGEVYADGETRSGAPTLPWGPALPVVLPGARDPVSAWPLHQHADDLDLPTRPLRLAGRELELERLLPLLGRLEVLPIPEDDPTDVDDGTITPALRMDGRAAAVAWIEGEAGIGKSALLGALVDKALDRGARVLAVAGDAIERDTAWHVWRRVLRASLGAPSSLPALATALAVRGHHDDVAALLAPVLGLGEPPPRRPGESGELRLARIVEALVDVLVGELYGAAVVVTVEDAQWIDSASWRLLAALRARLPGGLVLVASRTGEPLLPEARPLRGAADPLLALGGLRPSAVGTLLCVRLGVERLPPELVELVATTAAGHPLYAEELGSALRDAGVLQIEGRTARLAAPAALGELRLPAGIESAVRSRVDHLPAAQQLLLKAASVIGQVFVLSALEAIYPIEADRPALRSHADALAAADLFALVSEDPEPTWCFRHAITREVAWQLMLDAQRRSLHAAAAGWHEREGARTGALNRPVLAWHWAQAGEAALAVDHLEAAAAAARFTFANREAVALLDRALTLATADDVAVDAVRRARWERMLGEAWSDLGQIQPARDNLARAVARVGWPVPATVRALIPRLLGQVVRQVWHRVAPRAAWAGVGEGDVEAAQAFSRLAVVHHFLGEAPWVLLADLTALNLAERLGLDALVARGRANVAIATAMVRLPRLADWYGRQSVALARSCDDPAALAWALELVGAARLGWARIDEARAFLKEGGEVAAVIGDGRRKRECVGLLGTVSLLVGEHADAEALFQANVADSAAAGDDHVHLLALLGTVEARLLAGRAGEAAAAHAEATARLVGSPAEARGPGLPERMWLDGLTARLALVQGDPAGARAALEAFLRRAAVSAPTLPYAFGGYAAAADVAVALRVGDAAIDGEAVAAVATLRKFAHVFPMADPRAARAEYELALARGGRPSPRAARAARRAAAEHGLRYDVGRLDLLLARALPDGPERERAVAAAVAELTALGVPAR